MSNDLSACACMNLRKTARLVAQFYEQRLQPSDLRITQFTLLVMLGHLEPVSVTKLAAHMGMDRTTMTRNLRLLEKQGFIEGKPGDDARVRMLSLTEVAKITVNETRPYWETAQTQFLDKFGKDRWAKLHGELTDIAEIITAA